jgi:hypothetical protein
MPPLFPEPTPFVGRIQELADIAQRLADPACRLLTLVGPGGIGKTRLALRAAADHRDNYEDGVYFISLVSVGSPNTLASTIAAALNISLYGPDDPNVQISNYLRDKNMLVHAECAASTARIYADDPSTCRDCDLPTGRGNAACP